MPTHNRADVVGYAIRSVLGQTLADFELLIVGDGCTDTTGDVVARFGDPRIRWFDLPKAPHFGYANRNVALREARGDLLAFAAHDDLLFPDHLDRLSRAIDESSADWIYSRPLWVSSDGVIVPYPIDLGRADQLRVFMTSHNRIPASCVVYRRDCLDRFGDWPEDVPSGADWVYWRRIIGGGGQYAGYRLPTVLHFVASWRRPQRVGQPEAMALLALADAAGGSWPARLRLAPRAGESEQAAASRAMQEGGLDWCGKLRGDVDEVIDRLAWDHVLVLREQAARTRRSPGHWLSSVLHRVVGS